MAIDFKVLTAHAAAEWSGLVEGLAPEYRDLHFLPGYGLVYFKTYGQEPLLAYAGDGEGYVIQPFVKRSLEDLPFLRGERAKESWCDIANAYGYGGPAFRSTRPAHAQRLFAAFNECFVDYCRGERFASEFAGLHPFLHADRVLAAGGIVTPVPQKQVVYVDLTPDKAAIWAALRKGHKSTIRKAAACGIEVSKVEPDEANLAVLNRLYRETMTRNRAAARWLFPDAYFKNCFDCLGNGRAALFVAAKGTETVAAAIVLHDFETAYYHFSGSEARASGYSPNNILVHEIALWAKASGYKRLHLGGGVSSRPDDSLLSFKSGFSPQREMLHVYWRVLHAPTYEHLCELKIAHERAVGERVVDPDYFPVYRR